jgi:hypothetical protein
MLSDRGFYLAGRKQVAEGAVFDQQLEARCLFKRSKQQGKLLWFEHLAWL